MSMQLERSRVLRLVLVVGLIPVLLLGCRADTPTGPIQGNATVRMVYFYSPDCPHCHAVEEYVLDPLRDEYGDRVEILELDVSNPDEYELLIRAEEMFDVAPEDRGLPTLVIDGQIMIGEEQIRQEMTCLLDSCFAEGGTAWPEIPGLEDMLEASTNGDSPPLIQDPILGPGEIEVCEDDVASACQEQSPVWMAYFYKTGCQECSRAELDIAYVESRYSQLIIDQFSIYDDNALAYWMGERLGIDEVHSPAIFIGDDVLMGEEEINPDNLVALIEQYNDTGAPRVWDGFDEEDATASLIGRFQSWGPLTVVVAGLIDGLNPCAFATLVFLISYLSASERKGREILAVGGAFTFGVFIAYLAVGLGLYHVLDLLGETLTQLSRWVYGLTALMCAVLAVISILDFFKARRGDIEDMSLTLPERLRQRTREVIRKGQRTQTFVIGALVTGVVVSLLELACTGQIYLPTIVFVVSVPELQARALAYLVLYNLIFVVPLAVVFVLTYFGATSLQFGLFLRRRTATVKLITAVVFAALAVWLGMSLLN